MDCVFCKIANKEIPKNFYFEDRDLMIFDDINPAAPIHILIVPKKHIKDFGELKEDKLWIRIKDAAQRMVGEKQLDGKGYRFTINAGGAQVIDHLHIHITGPLGKSIEM